MGYSIKAVSERLGISSYTIRYYEKEGLLPFIKRDPKGNRTFEQSDIDWINLMTCFRATGMTVSSLKKMVDLAVEGNSIIPERRKMLEDHKLELQKRRLELERAFDAVDQKLSIYDEYEKTDSNEDIKC